MASGDDAAYIAHLEDEVRQAQALLMRMWYQSDEVDPELARSVFEFCGKGKE